MRRRLRRTDAHGTDSRSDPDLDTPVQTPTVWTTWATTSAAHTASSEKNPPIAAPTTVAAT